MVGTEVVGDTKENVRGATVLVWDLRVVKLRSTLSSLSMDTMRDTGKSIAFSA